MDTLTLATKEAQVRADAERCKYYVFDVGSDGYYFDSEPPNHACKNIITVYPQKKKKKKKKKKEERKKEKVTMDAKSLKLVDDACKLASAMINIPMMEFKSITIENAVEFEADLQAALVTCTQLKGWNRDTLVGMIACWLVGYYRAEQLAMMNALVDMENKDDED